MYVKHALNVYKRQVVNAFTKTVKCTRQQDTQLETARLYIKFHIKRVKRDLTLMRNVRVKIIADINNKRYALWFG